MLVLRTQRHPVRSQQLRIIRLLGRSVRGRLLLPLPILRLDRDVVVVHAPFILRKLFRLLEVAQLGRRHRQHLLFTPNLALFEHLLFTASVSCASRKH